MKAPVWLWGLVAAIGAFVAWKGFKGSGISLPAVFENPEESAAVLPEEQALAINAPATSTYALIARFEGFSPTPYRDAKGWSIGYGHFMGQTPTIQQVTQEQALDLLQNDVAVAAQAVSSVVQIPLSQNQYDALVSLAYNIGAGAFTGSTLVKLLNAGDTQGAAAQFARWNQSQGQILAALVDRRAQEASVFLS